MTKKSFQMTFRGKTLDLVFDDQNEYVFEVICEENDFHSIMYTIDLSDIVKCILFDDMSFIEGEWCEKHIKRLFKHFE